MKRSDQGPAGNANGGDSQSIAQGKCRGDANDLKDLEVLPWLPCYCHPAPSPKKTKQGDGDDFHAAPAAAADVEQHLERQQPPPAIVAAIKLPYDPHAKGGARIRLPDKLMEYLNNEVEKDVLWWQPDGDGFAFDSKTMQARFLDKHFEGTKLKSFIRSLNRW